MGFLDFLRPRSSEPPRKKVGRPTKEQAKLNAKQRLAEKKEELELAKIEIQMQDLVERKGKKRPIDAETVMEVVKYLRGLGLEVKPVKGGRAVDDDDNGLLGFVKDAMNGPLGAVIAQTIVGGQGAAAASPTVAAPALPPAPPPPSPAPAPPPPPQPMQRELWPSEQPPQGGNMGLKARYIIGQLQGKTPDHAAQWLLGQSQAQELIQILATTPDDELPALLRELEQSAPEYGGVFAWLRARPDWLIDTVRAVRRLAGIDVGSAAADMGI